MSANQKVSHCNCLSVFMSYFRWHTIMTMHNNVTVSCLPTLLHRGFYPKGGGEVVVTPTPLKTLSPVCITDAGRVERVKIHAFVAGAVPPKVRIPSQPHRYLTPLPPHLFPSHPSPSHYLTPPLPRCPGRWSTLLDGS